MTMNIDSSGMQWAGSIADFEEGTNASAQWGLNASAPVLSEVCRDNVDAGMAYGAESGGLEADGTEPCEDNMSSSEMSSALCAGIQTEIDRVFSNGIFIDNKVHFSDRVELLTELSYHTDHACDMVQPPGNNSQRGVDLALTGQGSSVVQRSDTTGALTGGSSLGSMEKTVDASEGDEMMLPAEWQDEDELERYLHERGERNSTYEGWQYGEVPVIEDKGEHHTMVSL